MTGKAGRFFTLLCITTLGLSQIFFNLIESNLAWFEGDFLFYIWVILLVQVVPLVSLFVVETLFFRSGDDSRGFRVWRTILYTLLVLSLLRQFQVVHSPAYQRLFGSFPTGWLFCLAGFLTIVLSALAHRTLALYLSFLGVLSLLFTGMFFKQTLRTNLIWNDPVSSPPAGKQQSPPIFFIVFDELSYQMLLKDGQIDSIGFPHFHRLAAESAWFTNATTNNWVTMDAIPGLLSGSLSSTESSATIFDALAGRYRVQVVDSDMAVERWLRSSTHPRNVELYRGKASFLRKDPLLLGEYLYWTWIDSNFFSLARPTSTISHSFAYHLTFNREKQAFLKMIDDASEEGALYYWHVSIPHAPFLFSAEGKLHSKEYSNFPYPELYDPSNFDRILQNYREQVRYADTILGVIVDRLKARALYNRSFLIVTSDHGLRVLGDMHNHIDLIARVPLAIHGPGVAPGSYDWDVQHVDVAPTLLDILHEPPYSTFQGVSAFDSKRPARNKVLRVFPGTFAYDAAAGSWKPETVTGNTLLSVISGTGASTQANTGFSAVMVIEDLFRAQEEERDFLFLYLKKDFPAEISAEQLQVLNENVKKLEPLPDTRSNCFKKGMSRFFLALAETKRIAAGNKIEPVAVDRRWHQAKEDFAKSGDLDSGLSAEIDKVLRAADHNGDSALDSAELASIINTRK